MQPGQSRGTSRQRLVVAQDRSSSARSCLQDMLSTKERCLGCRSRCGLQSLKSCLGKHLHLGVEKKTTPLEYSFLFIRTLLVFPLCLIKTVPEGVTLLTIYRIRSSLDTSKLSIRAFEKHKHQNPNKNKLKNSSARFSCVHAVYYSIYCFTS